MTEFNAALIPQIGHYPGEPLSQLTLPELQRLGGLLDSIQQGKTYPCPGGAGGGYGDIAAGAQVVVTDGDGRVLATTALQGGILNMSGCTFSYSVTVPDSSFYGVTVTHRGTLTYSRQDLAGRGWLVESSLG